MEAIKNNEIVMQPRHVNPAADGSALPSGGTLGALLDTDGDGMADEWETAHGLNPLLHDNNDTQLSLPLLGVPGYTNLEVYLHELSELRIREGL